ncbi:MAG: acyltransferase, partial [Ruminococcus sp.]|nr:acyltransferase [Ruminococcus sp.]
IFTFAIVIFHFAKLYPDMEKAYNIDIGWRIAVEFFFIVAGFLLGYKCKKSSMNALEYTKHRYRRLFPEYIVTLVIMVIYIIALRNMTAKESIVFITNAIDEILMLQSVGVSYVNINGALWYISSMLICGYFVYYLYRLKKDIFVKFIAPLCCIIIYSIIAKGIGCLCGNISHFTASGISFGLLRGFAGLSLGVIAFEIYLKLSKVEFTKKGSVTITTLETLLYLLILAYTFKFGSTRVDFIFLVLLFICAILSFLHSSKNIIMNNPVTNYLSNLSYSIYLCHIPALKLLKLFSYAREYHFILLPLFIGLTLALSVLVHYSCQFAVKLFRSHKDSIKNIFIKKTSA